MSASQQELRPLVLPKWHRFVLGNGLTVHVVARGDVPLVSVKLVFGVGATSDPNGVEGVTDLMAGLLRRGAGGESADAISEQVDFVGASLGGYASEDTVALSMSTPVKYLAQMLEVFAMVARSPDFPAGELATLKRRTVAALHNSLDDPGTIADRAVGRALFGEHPYGRDTSGTLRSLKKIDRPQLKEAFARVFRPNGGHLFVVGAVEPAKIRALVGRTLGGWKPREGVVGPVPGWDGPANPGKVVVVDKPEQTQVQVRIASRGVQRGHPDHFPLTLMNTVLGGGFTSRLVTEIRVKRGLTYGAGSHFDMMRHGGAFIVSSFTKTQSVGELIDVALDEVQRMKRNGPSAEELQSAARYVAGLYPARLETNDAMTNALADVVLSKLPEDWMTTYRTKVAAVSQPQAAAAAAKHLFGAERVIVLVGNAAALRQVAKKYGKVAVVQPKSLI